jgi:hypothetical protein
MDQCTAQVRYDLLRQRHLLIYVAVSGLWAIFRWRIWHRVASSRGPRTKERRHAVLATERFTIKKMVKKMMQRLARSIIPTWLLFVAILISGAHYNVTQAQDNPKSRSLWDGVRRIKLRHGQRSSGHRYQQSR